MGKIEEGPHYEIYSGEIAKWLEERQTDTWWNVDGDPLLTGRIPFPAPADELAAELRVINRPLLAEAQVGDRDAHGQAIVADEIGPRLIHWVGDLYRSKLPRESANDKYLSLQWKGLPHEWLLVEDGLTANQFSRDATSKAT